MLQLSFQLAAILLATLCVIGCTSNPVDATKAAATHPSGVSVDTPTDRSATMPNTETRAEQFSYLSDLRNFYSSYHNAKETAAWAGIVVYLAFLTGLASLLKSRAGEGAEMPERIGLTIAVSVMMLLAVIYLRTQFDLRKFASEVSSASFSLTAKMIREPLTTLDFNTFPDCRATFQAKSFLPKSVLDEMKKIPKTSSGKRVQLEFCAYGLLLFPFCCFLVWIWWRY